MDDRWLSVDEIAEYLGVSKDTVYTWVTSKGMPGHARPRKSAAAKSEPVTEPEENGTSADEASAIEDGLTVAELESLARGRSSS